MTREALEHGNEIKKSLDALYERRQELEIMREQCAKNIGISKTCDFYINTYNREDSERNSVYISAEYAYSAIDWELKDIDRKIEELSKEFADL